jgi:hypothetical protein
VNAVMNLRVLGPRSSLVAQRIYKRSLDRPESRWSDDNKETGCDSVDCIQEGLSRWGGGQNVVTAVMFHKTAGISLIALKKYKFVKKE